MFEDIILNDEYNPVLENYKTPCNNCNADCCGPVHFSKNELKRIWKKYNLEQDFMSLNKALKSGYIHEDQIGLRPLNYSSVLECHVCMFKNLEKDTDVTCEKGCLIYEDRPEVCQSYGKRLLSPCPYANLDKQPLCSQTKAKLIEKNKEKTNHMILNLISKNVGNKYKH